MAIRIDEVTGCWNWTGAIDKDGYGICSMRTGRSHRAHRVMYAMFHHAPPDALVIDHLCRNRACVNPSHLRLVTPRVNTVENSVSAQARNAHKTHCVRGHEFTTDNTYINKRGMRVCRECKRLHAARIYRNKRGGNISLSEMAEMQVGVHNGAKKVCNHGHPLSGENVSIDSLGRRICKTCSRATSARYKARHRVRTS